MANIKSSKKRILLAQRNQLQNRFYKNSIRTLTKKFIKQVKLFKLNSNANFKQQAKKLLNSIYSLIDKGLKKRIFHKNKAVRQKSRLANLYKTINV